MFEYYYTAAGEDVEEGSKRVEDEGECEEQVKHECEEVQVQGVVQRGEGQSRKRRRYVLSYPCCLQSKTLSLYCGPLLS